MSGGEVEALLGALDRQRATFRWKADGVDATGLATTVGVSSLSLGVLLKHLATVEELHSTVKLSGDAPAEPLRSHDWDADPGFHLRLEPGDTPESLYTGYDDAVARARARYRARLATGGLDQPVAANDPDLGPANLRRLLLDLLEEYGRHTGHADLLREAVDGRVGEDPPWDWRPPR